MYYDIYTIGLMATSLAITAYAVFMIWRAR
jgi:hypothetical protein